MTKQIEVKSAIKRIIALVLCLCIPICVFSSCSSKKEETGVTVLKNVTNRNIITNSTELTDSLLHYAAAGSEYNINVASSGLIEMYVCERTNSFCIYESNHKEMWSALPIYKGRTDNASDASMADLRIIGGTDIYELNTQDNSLAYNKASYERTDNGAAFIYDIFPDEKTAQKESYSKNDIGFRLMMNISLADGSMNVRCSYLNLTGNPDAYIESIDILKYFGAYNDLGDENFLLVPDGSGAIIKTSIYDESFEKLTFSVYGNDLSLCSQNNVGALIPAFGIKHGNFAFVSLIEKGDSVSTINADKATSETEYNIVYPAFNITPVLYENNTLYISKSPAVKEFSLCYRFLSGSNATYSGLASACREQLIRNSVLSTRTIEAADYLPLFLSVTGAAKKDLGPISYISSITDFEQAQDMLVRMKNKGINNVKLRYKGVFSGGTNSRDLKNAKILFSLGGSDGLEKLYNYMNSHKMSLYLDINILSSSNGFSGQNALNLKKEKISYEFEDDFANSLTNKNKNREVRNLSKLSKLIVSVLADTRYYKFSGFCINDAGSILYSDHSYNGLSGESAIEQIRTSIAPLSTSRSTMANNGNFCILKNVDSVVNIPLKANVVQSGAYISVPFVQLVLHGIVDYSGEPINTASNLEETLLKYIEYGACPHFEWSYESTKSDIENDIYYYDNTINDAAEFYLVAHELLSDLRVARMTDHYMVDDGIFCTEYDNGTLIYVNYTSEEYAVSGSVVDARSYLRIN